MYVFLIYLYSFAKKDLKERKKKKLLVKLWKIENEKKLWNLEMKQKNLPDPSKRRAKEEPKRKKIKRRGSSFNLKR
jgi:hypothetical protein